jgi:hypothetical protein
MECDEKLDYWFLKVCFHETRVNFVRATLRGVGALQAAAGREAVLIRAGRVGTFHIILQRKHIQLMTASVAHVTNLTPTFHVILESKHQLMTASRVHVTNLIPGVTTVVGRMVEDTS